MSARVLIRSMNPIVCKLKHTHYNLHEKSLGRLYSLYSPDYLSALEPKVPLYNALNIQMNGHNFTVLENYQKFINGILKSMDIEVDDSWASPPQHMQIQKFKPQSMVKDADYSLKRYERSIRVCDLPSTSAAILLEVMATALPEGVHLKVCHHEAEHEDARYVPDRELLDLKSQLDTLGGPSNAKRKN